MMRSGEFRVIPWRGLLAAGAVVLVLSVGLARGAGAATITEYPTTGAPTGITAGPDGALWFTEWINGIGRITTAGAITEFPVPHYSYDSLRSITAGPDGALWFTRWDTGIGRITTAGIATEFALPTGSSPHGITAGPDGALWFTEAGANKIGRITTAGAITEFPLPTSSSNPNGITAGPDGALWFTESAASARRIGRITTDGTITEFTIPSFHYPTGITAGPDGALWFNYMYGGIGRITTAGVVTEFLIPNASSWGYSAADITAGPDGAIWFIAETSTVSSKIGRITTAGVITEFAVPGDFPMGITAGPDGALWFTEHNSFKIGRITTDTAPTLAAAVSLNGSAFHTGQQITYQATLTPGSTPTQVDIYLGVLLPDGMTFLSFVPGPGGTITFAFGAVPVPFAANVTLTSTVVPFSYTFTGTEPVGTYYTYAGLAVAGSDPLQAANQLSLGVQAFQFTP
ncbi:hypothetical protein [Candidatus Methylomirabilis sp.]|uniref:Vgb family protein n=1 Tax=Candidatus Methylomirabilis sp. TaxID=2032687 RepID=UPI002A620894|nr:hypothetical protein [Candidatus Methylomirabilis sp.]